MIIGQTMQEIAMSLILEPGHQLREKITEEGLEELSRSIAKVGLQNPILVRKKESGYEIVSGHRRFLAVKELGWEKIMAIIKEANDEETRIAAIHENLHREDMSPIEEAGAIKKLLDSGDYSKRDVARMCSKSESWVDSRLSLLDMPTYLKEAVDVGAISVSAARELNAITDDDARKYYSDHAIKSGATRELCAFWRGRWEVEKITRDPSAAGDATFSLNPPPMEPTIPCFWCEKEFPVRIIDHIRVCPRCRMTICEAKSLVHQQTFEESREAAPAS